MKPEERFGFDGLERQKRALEEASKPASLPQDGFSRLGQILVNLPWVLLSIAFIIWWLNK